ncbi:MAG TPA: FTR1 family protein [Thermodesulfobacteriota bacterium]
MRAVRTILCILFLIVPAAGLAWGGENGWADTSSRIAGELQKAVSAYEAGDAPSAKAGVTGAYFDIFEAGGMEAAISERLGDSRKTELESMFAGLRGAISSGRPVEDVRGRATALAAAVEKNAARLDELERGGSSPVVDFFNSFLIILREGLEAILVVSALSAWLVKSGHADKVRTVYRGAAIAIVLSVLTAVALQALVPSGGAGREALEGATMLVAAAILFYVSYWLIARASAQRWQRHIKSMAEGALSRANLFSLGFASFLAVYREGAETVLFYSAAYSSSTTGWAPMLGGFLAGAALLTVSFYVIRYTSMRLPIGPFFAATSVLLYYLAFSFTGKGVLELQEAGIIGATPVDRAPVIHILGIYPTMEGLALQALLLAALAAALLFALRPREKGGLSDAGAR